MTARRDGKWIRCGKCGHKLGMITGIWPEFQAMPALEVKCHSCKETNYIMVGSRSKGGES